MARTVPHRRPRDSGDSQRASRCQRNRRASWMRRNAVLDRSWSRASPPTSRDCHLWSACILSFLSATFLFVSEIRMQVNKHWNSRYWSSAFCFWKSLSCLTNCVHFTILSTTSDNILSIEYSAKHKKLLTLALLIEVPIWQTRNLAICQCEIAKPCQNCKRNWKSEINGRAAVKNSRNQNFSSIDQ